MKRLIILVVLVAAGYFAYQHFLNAPGNEAATEEEAAVSDTGSYSGEQPPPLPDSCAELGKNLENAIYGNTTGQTSFAQRNTAYRKFVSCLRDAAFSDAQINGTVAKIEERAKGYARQDR
jgi:hypothetical protein